MVDAPYPRRIQDAESGDILGESACSVVLDPSPLISTDLDSQYTLVFEDLTVRREWLRIDQVVCPVCSASSWDLASPMFGPEGSGTAGTLESADWFPMLEVLAD